jgi:hypothetical protein
MIGGFIWGKVMLGDGSKAACFSGGQIQNQKWSGMIVTAIGMFAELWTSQPTRFAHCRDPFIR